MLKDGVDIRSLLADIADAFFKEKQPTVIEKLHRKFAALFACRAAIKSGDKLSDEEIERLIRDWQNVRLPFSCAHGRPTAIRMTWAELEKKFLRR